MQYRRAKTPGGTYFFTVVTHAKCHSERSEESLRWCLVHHVVGTLHSPGSFRVTFGAGIRPASTITTPGGGVNDTINITPATVCH
jgi:hypothetical protein